MKLDKRQKIVLVLTICAFAFLGWQIYDLFFAGPDISPPPAVVKKAPAKAVKTVKATTKKTNAPKVVNQSASNKATKQDVPVTESKPYLAMVEQLEMYKMQHEVLQQQLAIAKAQQQIARVNSQNDASSGQAPAMAAVTAGGSGLRLSYVAKLHGQWQATIDDAGQYQTVKVGGQLLDGSKVLSINADGVELQKGKKKKQLHFAKNW